jgi:hypothetical protein
MRVKQTFVGKDLVLHHAGEVLPSDAYAPETLQQLVRSGLVEQDKAPEVTKEETPKKAPAKKRR